MPTYERIMVNRGGGIQDNERKSDWEDGGFVCIGLGGMGKDALKQLKREVYRRIKPDDLDAPVPDYKKIHFLAVDSDHIDILHTKMRTDCWDIQMDTEYFNLLLPRKPVTEASRPGTKGNRQLGRALLMERADLFADKLQAVIREAVREMTGKLHISLFSGVSGGTGGGILIDVCYILRHVLKQLDMDDVQVNGFFFVPDSHNSNGYETFMELEHYMELGETQGRFIHDYGKFQVDVSCTPVDTCNLISVPANDGSLKTRGYREALGAAADYVISCLSKPSPDSKSFQEHLEDTEQSRRNIQMTQGSSFRYNLFCVSHGEIPVSHILMYLGCRLFQRLWEIMDHTPTPKDVEDFIEVNRLSPEHLISQLTEGITYPVPCPENMRRKDIENGGYGNGLSGSSYKKLVENYQRMAGDLENYDISQEPDSLISRIFASLCQDYAAEPRAGLIFSIKMLGGQDNLNLMETFYNHIGRPPYPDGEETRHEIEQIRQAVKKAGFITWRKYREDFVKALEHMYICDVKCGAYVYMENLLDQLPHQLWTLNRAFFIPLNDTLDSINYIWSENLLAFEKGHEYESPCTWNILSVRELQKDLDQIVEKLDLELEMKKMAGMLLEHWKEWITGNEDHIIAMLSRFILQEFLPVLDSKIAEWLDTSSQTARSMIQGVVDREGEPVLWENYQADLEKAAKKRILLIPHHNPELVAEADKMKQKGYDVCPVQIQDRISAITVYSGVSLETVFQKNWRWKDNE